MIHAKQAAQTVQQYFDNALKQHEKWLVDELEKIGELVMKTSSVGKSQCLYELKLDGDDAAAKSRMLSSTLESHDYTVEVSLVSKARGALKETYTLFTISWPEKDTDRR